MSFGTLSASLGLLGFFNNKLEIVYEKEGELTDDDEGLLIDVSGSMDNHEGVLKMVFSALKAVYSLVGADLHIPRLEGTTSLLLAADKMATKLGKGRTLRILTDGIDNESCGNPSEIVIGADADGTAVYSQLAKCGEFRKQGGSLPEWNKEWFNVVVQHLALLGAQVSIIGVGSDIGKVIHEVTKKAPGVSLAWLPSSKVSVKQVTAVVAASVKQTKQAKQGKRQTTGMAPTAATSADADIAHGSVEVVKVVTIESPEAAEAEADVTTDVLQTVAAEAGSVKIDGREAPLPADAIPAMPLTADEFKDLVATMEALPILNETSVATVDRRAARTVFLWFVQTLVGLDEGGEGGEGGKPAKRGKLAGALIGGRFPLFLDPAGASGKSPWTLYINKMLSAAAHKSVGLLEYFQKESSEIHLGRTGDVDKGGGACRKFANAPHYALHKTIDAAVLDELKADAEFALPEASLQKSIGGKALGKRKLDAAEEEAA